MLMLSPFYDERNAKLMESLLLPCVTMQKQCCQLPLTAVWPIAKPLTIASLTRRTLSSAIVL